MTSAASSSGESALHFEGGDGAGLPGFLHGSAAVPGEEGIAVVEEFFFAAVPCEEGLAVVEEFFFARSDPAEVDRIGSGEEIFTGSPFSKNPRRKVSDRSSSSSFFMAFLPPLSFASYVSSIFCEP